MAVPGVLAGHQQHGKGAIARHAEVSARFQARQWIPEVIRQIRVNPQLQPTVDFRRRIQTLRVQAVTFKHRIGVFADGAKPLQRIHQT